MKFGATNGNYRAVFLNLLDIDIEVDE